MDNYFEIFQFDELIKEGELCLFATEMKLPDIDFDDIYTITYTSGTTGMP